MYFSLNINIEAGDIVLIFSNNANNKLIAKGISLATFGKFSHAGIFIDERRLLESVGGTGVQMTSIARLNIENKDNIMVLRLKNNEKRDTFKSRLKTMAYSLQGNSYDLKGALKSIAPFTKKNTNGFFCSELVSFIYEELDVKLFSKPSHQVNPNDFPKCGLLEDITDLVLSSPKEFILKRLEGKKVPCLDNDIPEVENKDVTLNKEFLEKAKSIFKEFSQNEPTIIWDIPSILEKIRPENISNEIDKKLCILYDEVGILDNAIQNLEKDKDQHDLDLLDSELKTYGLDFVIDESTFNEHLFTNCSKQMQEKEEMIMYYQKLNLATGFKILLKFIKYNKLAFQLSNQLLEHVSIRQDKINEYIKKNNDKLFKN